MKDDAVQLFVSMFNGSYSKLSPGDVDYKIYDNKKNLISYALIILDEDKYDSSKEISIPVRDLIKVSDKRLSPVVIWAFKNGILYCKTKFITGVALWVKDKLIPEPYSSEELILFPDKKSNFKFIEK